MLIFYLCFPGDLHRQQYTRASTCLQQWTHLPIHSDRGLVAGAVRAIRVP